MFSLAESKKNKRSLGSAFLGPSVMFWTNLVEVYYIMLDTKYQGSMPSGFRQDVLCFPYISLII